MNIKIRGKICEFVIPETGKSGRFGGEWVLGTAPGEHYDDYASLFPNHLPEICNSVGHGPLGHDVSRVPRIMIRLKKQF